MNQSEYRNGPVQQRPLKRLRSAKYRRMSRYTAMCTYRRQDDWKSNICNELHDEDMVGATSINTKTNNGLRISNQLIKEIFFLY